MPGMDDLELHECMSEANAVHSTQISVRPEPVEGLWVRSWWFDKLTPKGCEDLCEATNG